MDNVGEFFDEVTDSVHGHAKSAIEQFQNELRKISDSKNVPENYSENLNKSCQDLLQRTMTNFEYSLSIFQLYTIRNILVTSSTLDEERQRAKQQRIDYENKHPINDNVIKGDPMLDQQLADLHHRYKQIQQEYRQLSTEHADIKQLITDMRSAVFNLRVAMQSFEVFNIAPLSDTTESIQQYYQKLQHYSQEAKGLLKKLGVEIVTEDLVTNIPEPSFLLTAHHTSHKTVGFKETSSMHLKAIENDSSGENSDLLKYESENDQFPTTDLHVLAQIQQHLK